MGAARPLPPSADIGPGGQSVGQAAQFCLEQRSDIRLIFTDIHMPGAMDRLKLAHFVKDGWPPIKIIATSGHAKMTERELPEGSRFLPNRMWLRRSRTRLTNFDSKDSRADIE